MRKAFAGEPARRGRRRVHRHRGHAACAVTSAGTASPLEDLRIEPDAHLDGVFYLDERRLAGAGDLRAAGAGSDRPVLAPGQVTRRARRSVRPTRAWSPARPAFGEMAPRLAAHRRNATRICSNSSSATGSPSSRGSCPCSSSARRSSARADSRRRPRARSASAAATTSFPNALANGLHDVRYSSWARRIELHAGGVRVHADGGNVLARFCVLTVPFPAVGTSIEFRTGAASRAPRCDQAAALRRRDEGDDPVREALLARQAGERLDRHRPHLPAVLGGDERTGGTAAAS